MVCETAGAERTKLEAPPRCCAALQNWEWGRLLWFPWLHADDVHLYYNMASLIWKGRVLEAKLKSRGFLFLVAELCVTSALLHLAAAVLLAQLGSTSFMHECTVGFSGVLFGLKVLIARLPGPGYTDIAGVRLPTKVRPGMTRTGGADSAVKPNPPERPARNVQYAAWGELLLCFVLIPDSSLLGHLCGILAGLAHVHVLRTLWRDLRQTRLWWDLKRSWRGVPAPPDVPGPPPRPVPRPVPVPKPAPKPPARDPPPNAPPPVIGADDSATAPIPGGSALEPSPPSSPVRRWGWQAGSAGLGSRPIPLELADTWGTMLCVAGAAHVAGKGRLAAETAGQAGCQ